MIDIKTLDLFILTLFSHGDKARISTLYHLLRGKRTASILIYGYFYYCLPFFGLLPQLTESDYHKTVQRLSAAGFLIISEDNLAAITQIGQDCLQNADLFQPLPHLDGYRFAGQDELFWEILTFATQVLSEKSHGNNQYVPLESNVYRQKIFKRWLKQQPENVSQLLYNEWYLFLQSLPEKDALLFASQLSGYLRTGLTLQQAADHRQEEILRTELTFKNYLHQLMSAATQKVSVFPLMKSLTEQFTVHSGNQSAAETFSLFCQGMSAEAIAVRRRLRPNTIYDHIIDCSFQDAGFPYLTLLSDEETAIFSGYRQQHPNVRNWQWQEIHSRYPQLTYHGMRFYQLACVQKEAVR